MPAARLLLLAAALSAPAAAQGFDLPYASDDPSQVLDWYVPDPPAAPGPVVIHVHGGPGDKSDAAPSAGNLPDLLLRNGVTLVAINFRPFPAFQHPAQLEDVAAAVQHVRANAAAFGIDPARLALWGYSSGATLGGWLAYGADLALPGGTPAQQQSTRPQALLNEAGLTNFLLMSPGYPSTFPGGATLGDLSPAFLESVSVSEMVLDVPRAFTPPVASYYGLQESPPPLTDPHDATLMKDLHQKLSAFPDVAAASLMLQKQPGSGVIVPHVLAAWLLHALQVGHQLDVGKALPGTGRVAPRLVAAGDWSPGGSATLSFVATVPAPVPVWIVAGAQAASAPFKGGTLVPAPEVPLFLQAGADGTLLLPLQLPGNLQAGQSFYLQALQPDAGAAHGLALSNAVYARLTP